MGVAALFATLLCMGALASSASAAFDYYWDGFTGVYPAVFSPNHTLTSAGTRLTDPSGGGVCIQGFHTSGAAAGGTSCVGGSGQLAHVDYPCACTLLYEGSFVSGNIMIRARVDF